MPNGPVNEFFFFFSFFFFFFFFFFVYYYYYYFFLELVKAVCECFTYLHYANFAGPIERAAGNRNLNQIPYIATYIHPPDRPS